MDCSDSKSYYVCSAGFIGCCTHDPCTSGICKDDEESTSDAKDSTSTTESVKNQSDASAATITNSIVTTTSASSGATTTETSASDKDSETQASSDSESDSDSPINGALIGGIVGGILAFILAAFVIFFLCRRRRKSKKSYDSVHEKTPELDTPNQPYQFANYEAYSNSPGSIYSPDKKYAPAKDPGALASSPLLPNELPASYPSHAPLELPSPPYNPPLPELPPSPTRELINQQNSLQNSLQNSPIQSGRATPDPNFSPQSKTTPEGAILRSNLNTSIRGKGPRKEPDPRHHVMSFMSYDNKSDTRIEGQLGPSASSDQSHAAGPAAGANSNSAY